MANLEGKWGVTTVGTNLWAVVDILQSSFISRDLYNQGQESSHKNVGILFGNIDFPLGNGDDFGTLLIYINITL